MEGSELLQVEQVEQELVQGLELVQYITLKQRTGRITRSDQCFFAVSWYLYLFCV